MGSTSSSFQRLAGLSPSVDTSPNNVATLGIKLSFLRVVTEIFSKDIGQKTTAEICSGFIKPATSKYRCSYCEYLADVDATLVGKATVFISHAWTSKFLDVVEALVEFFHKEPNVIIWFDIFSNNQHLTHARTFEWWTNTFRGAIKEFGRTVVVLAPWNDPVLLTRGWCIWEVYCSVVEKCDSRASQSLFIEDVEKGLSNRIKLMLGKINCEKSECSVPSDRRDIHEAIKRSIGFQECNKRIFDLMREWIIQKFTEETDRKKKTLGEDHITTVDAIGNLALLYKEQGYFAKAESLYLECIEKCKHKNEEQAAYPLPDQKKKYFSMGRFHSLRSLTPAIAHLGPCKWLMEEPLF
jgi:hypothetical protein